MYNGGQSRGPNKGGWLFPWLQEDDKEQNEEEQKWTK